MIVNKFSELLHTKKMDKRDVVKLTGLDSHTVLKLYRGITQGIDFKTLDKLCFALDCTPNDLFKYIPDDIADKLRHT